MVSTAATRPLRARQIARSAIWTALKLVVGTPGGLAAVNRLHRILTPAQKRRFFYLCADDACPVEGPWVVDFAGRRLLLPLHRDFALAWMAAIGFHGYDTEVHDFYAALVRGPRPPRVFFDVGASYGLHSLKLLAHGVRVVSFEPNVACHDFFLESCWLNGVPPDLRSVAVGRAAGRATLVVPDGRTYLGTMAPDVIERWGDTAELTTHEVDSVTLDDVVVRDGVVPDLVKIDTEGSEPAVLEGAAALLESARPVLVLESWPEREARTDLFRLLAAHGYRLHALRLACPPSSALALDEFLASPATNFAAGVAAPRR